MPKSYALVLLVLFTTPCAGGADRNCTASGGYDFVCGLQNAEDLVAIPGTRWIIASGMAAGGSLSLIDATQKTAALWYPGTVPVARQDMAVYGRCPGSPDPNHFISHGLNLRVGGMDHATLYVVSHGDREAIEVFDVDAGGDRPVVTWIGCVLMLDGLAANSVASFTDGSLVATVLMHPGKTFKDLIAGEPTGAVYAWSPGDTGFVLLAGTELAGNNGIEVSADEREIFVVSTGLKTVVAYTRSNPARRLRSTRRFAFSPDNVHMGGDGRLIAAGMIDDEPACGGFPSPEAFDFAKLAACPRGYIAVAIDPVTMRDTVISRGPSDANFSNATMALPLGGEIWIGTFSGDRIGYRSLGHD